MKTIQQGFTLIELMIVVAIIGILAAIAIPQYNNYVAQSQLSAALAEISGGKTQYENRLQRGDDGFSSNGSLTNDAGEVGLSDPTSACSAINLNDYTSTHTVPATGTGSGEINCTIDGNPQIDGEFLALDRNGDGTWLCTASAGVPDDLMPPSCSQ